MNYFEKFCAQPTIQKRYSAVNTDLLTKFEFHARYHGDRDTKREMSNAKRTATILEQSIKTFGYLSVDTLLEIKAAASAMRVLSNDLKVLAAWAKEYKLFCDSERKIEYYKELEKIAAQRWKTSDDLSFELNIMKELCTEKGQVAFGNWVHSTGRHLDCNVNDISCVIDRTEFDGVKFCKNNGSEKHLAATIIKNVTIHKACNKWQPSAWTGLRVVCGVIIYEEYIAYRQVVYKAAALVLQTASA